MSQEIDYAIVLADLESRRAALDAAIAGVKAILGQGPMEALPGGSGTITPTPHTGTVPGDEEDEAEDSGNL